MPTAHTVKISDEGEIAVGARNVDVETRADCGDVGTVAEIIRDRKGCDFCEFGFRAVVWGVKRLPVRVLPKLERFFVG